MDAVLRSGGIKMSHTLCTAKQPAGNPLSECKEYQYIWNIMCCIVREGVKEQATAEHFTCSLNQSIRSPENSNFIFSSTAGGKSMNSGNKLEKSDGVSLIAWT